MELQYFQYDTQAESAIHGSDMDKMWDNFHRMELTSEKPWKYLTDEVRRIKEYAVSHIDLQAWADNMEAIFGIRKNQAHHYDQCEIIHLNTCLCF